MCGRRLFDRTRGWGGSHPVGAPVGVVTHHAPDDADAWKRTTFVDGVEVGIARAVETAGENNVSVMSSQIAAQALELGLVDEVVVSLVRLLRGEGVPYFTNLTAAPHWLDDPIVIPGTRATHLRYGVRRGLSSSRA